MTAPAPSVSDQIAARLRACREGWAIGKIPPGAGKTVEFCNLALERAQKQPSPNATTTRAPAGSKSALLLPTSALAVEKTHQVRARGGDVQRRFGMTSAPYAPGRGCRWPQSLTLFSAAGQSARRTLCDGGSDKRRGAPCEHRASCDTYKSDGVDGDPSARFAIGPQSMGPQLAGHAGTGLLGVDDPPPTVLDTHAFTADELEQAAQLDERTHPPFETAFGVGLAPILKHLAAWLRTSPPPGDLFVLADLVPPEMLEVLEDLYAGRRIEAILKSQELILLRQVSHRGAPLGAAMQMARVLGDALRRKMLNATVELRAGVPALRTFGILEWFERVIVHFQGTGILLAADADLHYPILCKLLAAPPIFFEIAAPDGAPISRRLMHLRAAGPASSIFDGKKFKLAPAALRAVEWAVSWALESPTAGDGVLFVTRRPFRFALEAAAPATTPARQLELRHAWAHDLKQEPEALDLAVAQLAQLLAPLAAIPLGYAHFGATRGLDVWSNYDATITLGDPWIDVAHVKLEAVFLHGNAHDAAALAKLESERAVAYAGAELEQAHGRLRTIHRQKPGRQLHVGRVIPRGWEGRFTRDDPAKGRPKNGAKAAPEVVSAELQELRALVAQLGGQRGAAAAASLNRETLRTYMSGRTAPPAGALAMLRWAASVRGAVLDERAEMVREREALEQPGA